MTQYIISHTYKKMFYRIVLFALMMYGGFSTGPFRKMRPCNTKMCEMNFRKEIRIDPEKIFQPDFVMDKMNKEIKKQLKNMPKILIVPPVSDEEDWDSGEVAWEPEPNDDGNYPPDKDGNSTELAIPVRIVPTSPVGPPSFVGIGTVDFEMSTFTPLYKYYVSC